MSDGDTLKLVLEASDVNSVVWIDDRFDVLVPSLADAVEWLGTLHYAKVLPAHSALADLKLDDDSSAWSDALGAIKESQPEVFAEIAPVLADQVQALNGGADAAKPAEYTAGDLASIMKSFGGIQCLGLAAWNERKATLIASMSKRTLVIIDREFVIEGSPVRMGEEILKELVQSPGLEARLVMLTHSVGQGGVAGLRRELSGDNTAALHRFAVVAKGGPGDAAVRLRDSIRVVMTHGTCFTMLQSITKVMKNGVDTALTELMDQSVYDLDAVVFEKSLEEGASEVDVLTRLVLLRQRVEVETHLAEDGECHALVNSLRKLRSVPGSLPRDASTTRFEELRKREIFDPAELVNRRYSPLACGDLFQVEGQQKKLWLLLAQPCDIAVRPDGKRKFAQGVLVLAKPVEASVAAKVQGALASVRVALEASDATRALELLAEVPAQVEKLSRPPPSHRYFPLHGKLDEAEWQLDFNDWTPVSLECLELCAFNKDGALKLDPNAAPAAPLLPGWQRRFEKACALLQKAAGNVPTDWVLGGTNFSNRIPKIQNGVLSFKCKRVGRIRAPRAVAAYSAFSSSQSRAAFDHDFAELLSTTGR